MHMYEMLENHGRCVHPGSCRSTRTITLRIWRLCELLNVRCSVVGSDSFAVMALQSFYTSQPPIKSLPLAVCKMWPIWRRPMSGFGEFVFRVDVGVVGHV